MNDRTLRFGDYQRLLTAGCNEVSFNTFTPEPEREAGGELIACPPQRVNLNTVEAPRVLQPYVTVRFMEQVRAVVPLALYLALFLQHMVERLLDRHRWSERIGRAVQLEAQLNLRR